MIKPQNDTRKTFLCISCEFKGHDFIRTCHQLGHKVYLVTAEKTRDMGWQFEYIEEAFYMPDEDGRIWNLDDLVRGTAYLMRTSLIDRMIALDDYDVNKAALLREEFRMPGMGQTTARHFYDKLAMRMQALEAGIAVPAFSALFEDQAIKNFLDSTEGPWLIKPRSDAGALGIRKFLHAEECLEHCEKLGENRYRYLIESFKPGGVYHVDSLSFHDEILFSRCSGYRKPPFEVAHGGGIFSSATLPLDNEDVHSLKKMNKEVMAAFGMRHGASHSEFIKCDTDGKFYFLETSARVGGAHLAEMVTVASGINLWSEWAKIECALLTGQGYSVPEDQQAMAGIITSLSHEKHPDYSSFSNEHLAWKMNKDYHVGLIFKADTKEEVHQLLDQAGEKIREDFHASMPLKE